VSDFEELDDLIGEDLNEEAPVEEASNKDHKSTKKKPKKDSEPKVEKKISAFSDDRKLTSKGKESLRARWSVANSGKSRDGVMQGLLNAARGKFGADRVFGSRQELEQLAIGIPTPSLAFEYLIANDVFPLSSVMMLAGSWGSCKSALSYEFFRWFYELSGLAVHIDTENKFDAEFACDIMRVPRDSTPIISNRANSLEQMQSMLTHYLKEVQKMLNWQQGRTRSWQNNSMLLLHRQLGGGNVRGKPGKN